jgi:hypothetical protein
VASLSVTALSLSTLAKPPPNLAAAAGSAFVARVLPTNQEPKVNALTGRSTLPPQGSMDTFTAQYAPETYAVAFSGATTPSVVASTALKEPTTPAVSVDPTFGGTDIPYFDHEIEKIQAAYQGNATLTPPLPTFAMLAASDPPPPRAAPPAASATATAATAPPQAAAPPAATATSPPPSPTPPPIAKSVTSSSVTSSNAKAS